MLVFTIPALSADRPAFVDAYPALRDDHRNAQKAMFGAAREAGLSTSEFARDAMLCGINQLLGLSIQSRRQLTPDEMNAVTVAIESGAFNKCWETPVRAEIVWRAEIHLSVPAQRVQIPISRTVEYDRTERLWA